MISHGEAVGLIVAAGVGLVLALHLDGSYSWVVGAIASVGISTLVWE